MSRFDEQEFKSKMMRATEAMLEWAKSHPDCTLRELEERVQEWKVQMGAELLEASVAVQNALVEVEEPCSCGGRWVFQGYRERNVMTSQGAIRVKRAYFTCERCGQGFFPLG